MTLSPMEWSFPSQRRILLLDDEPTILAPTARYLRRLAFLADTAETREAAFDLMSRHEYHAAILDLRLSPYGADESLSVLKELRTRNRGVKVIALSAFISEEILGELQRLGLDTVLRKPQPLAHLAATVIRLMGEAV